MDRPLRSLCLQSSKSLPRTSVRDESDDSNNNKKILVLSPKSVKRISKEQTKFLSRLITEETEKIFGDIGSVEELLMKRFLTLGIEDDHGHLVAGLCLHSQPNIPAVPPWEWDHWIQNLYGIENVDSRNTFWIHLLVFDERYEMFFVRPMMQYVFKCFKNILYILLVLPPGVVKVDCLEEFATKLLPKDCQNPGRSQSLYLISQDRFMVNYVIRRAVEEDNDDLVPLIDLYSKRLVELYGRYYIAEILTRHKDSGRQIVVAEYEGSAVAVVILNEVVNYEVLNEEFELTPFNGFKKRTEDDCVDIENMSAPEIIMSATDLTETVETERSPKGLFAGNFEDEDDFLVDVAESDSEYSLVFTNSDLFAFDEDEEEDDEKADTNTEYDELLNSVTSYEILKEIEKVKMYEVDPRLTYVDMMEKLSRSMISTRSRTGNIPKFFGKGNAFCLEVAACHPDHESSLNFVLEAVFECFPDRDYCILSIPSHFRVEHWMYRFNRVCPRASSTFPYDLYECHKNSLLGKLEVHFAVNTCPRSMMPKPLMPYSASVSFFGELNDYSYVKCGKVATREHMQELYALLSTIPTRAIILSHFEICMEYESSPYQCFVFLCEGHVIGTAVVSEEYNIDYIDAQYDIREWVPLNCFRSGTFGVIESMVISPIFLSAGRYFKRELHRLSDFEVLFYKHRTYDKSSYRERPLASLLHWLLPVLPRRMPEYDFKMLQEEGYQVADFLHRRDHYALYLSTISQSSVERLCLNNRIVVVGCSNTAIAFLESLLLKQHNPNYMCNFNNVTLVCSDGIHQRLPKKFKELFMVQKNFLTERYRDMISLKTYVNTVTGNLTQINRKEQYIVINDHYSLCYDLLFLMCGEKFQKPLQEYRMPFAENPENVFLINGPMDGNKAMIKLKEFQKENDDNIIVYGHFLQAYSCLAGLLEHGILGSKIVLVEPFPYSMNIDKKRRHNISVFNDPDIYHATMEYIANQGIKVYSSYYFIDWNFCFESNIITAVQFESKHKMLEMSCLAIFFFYDKSISPRVYQVINQAGLVFDGRLVVDSNCKTNDERIYGAGTLTKYSRKYFAANMVHKFFNRVEIGRKLGTQIRNMLVPGFVKRCDPKKHGWNFHLDIRDRLVPKYEQPIMRYCRLPGDLFYLSIVKPGRRIPLETASSMENYGQVFITGSCRNLDHQGFFKLHFNEYNRVETITCLTKFPIDVKNIYYLWGKHEKMLNNLQLRFEMVLITDFFEYFKQPWAYALYHDRFNRLLDELNNLMTSSVGSEGECLITDIIEMYKQRKWQPLTTEQQEETEERFPKMLYPKIIEQKVLDFIQENLSYLPMYAHPVVVRNILEGFDKSPLFSK